MTKIKNNHISFEFFPARTNTGVDKLANTAKTLAKLNPEYFSVTYGAGGSNKNGTLDTTRMLQEITPIQVTPHISGIASTKQEILDLLTVYQSQGIKHLVTLRGDLPANSTQKGEFVYAADLVKSIRDDFGDTFKISVAAYPETHPQASNCNEDLINFKKKVDAGANEAITQYFFNSDAYFDFVERATKIGINIPITPGIMPIANFDNLVRFSLMCGAEIPRWLSKRLEAYAADQDSMLKVGLEFVCELCDRLIAGGAPGLHFYTLNKADLSCVIWNKLV